MFFKGRLNESQGVSPFQHNNAASSPLTPPRSTTSNRPSHEPHGPASVNQGVAIFAGMSHLLSL
jgi:hypothetical protein